MDKNSEMEKQSLVTNAIHSRETGFKNEGMIKYPY